MRSAPGPPTEDGSTAAWSMAITPPIEWPASTTRPVAELGDEPGDDPPLVHQTGSTSVAGRPSEAREVEREDAAQARQPGRDPQPVEMRATQAVDQHERRVRRPIPGPIPHRPVQIDGGKLGEVEAHGGAYPGPRHRPAHERREYLAGQGRFWLRNHGEVVASERGPQSVHAGTRDDASSQDVHTPSTFTYAHRDALPYVRAAAKASLFARLHSCGHPEYPSSRGSVRLLPATTRPRGGE